MKPVCRRLCSVEVGWRQEWIAIDVVRIEIALIEIALIAIAPVAICLNELAAIQSHSFANVLVHCAAKRLALGLVPLSEYRSGANDKRAGAHDGSYQTRPHKIPPPGMRTTTVPSVHLQSTMTEHADTIEDDEKRKLLPPR